MAENQSFLTFPSLRDAEEFMGFQSLARRFPGAPNAIRAHVRDHRLREVSPTLEVSFEEFVLSQARWGTDEARRRAHDVSYGPSRSEASVGGHAATCYELGEDPPPDDPDPRQPSVVTWADGELFCFMASIDLPVARLLEMARSLYEPGSAE